MAVQDTPPGATAVNLSERELLIYQAGQSFGAAQALRQVAEQVNRLSQTINAQANKQATAGQALLDQALQREPGKAPAPAAKPKNGAGKRLLKAAVALLGADD